LLGQRQITEEVPLWESIADLYNKMLKMGKKKTAAKAKKKSWKRRLLMNPKGFSLLVVGLYLLTNFFVQLYRKPAEIFSFVAFLHYKTPEENWAAYEDYFIRAEQYGIPAELLAAIAQAESSGSPWATPRWTFNWRPHDVFDLYRPETSAVGLFQFTNGTYERVREHCDGAHSQCPDIGWTAPTRLSAGESIQRAAQNLHQELLAIAPKNQQAWADLAPIVHLCGPGVARRVARSGMPSTLKCGSHNAKIYLRDIKNMAARMSRIRGPRESSVAGR
jgi:hypothetical protein